MINNYIQFISNKGLSTLKKLDFQQWVYVSSREALHHI